jgi:hypothetical protein
VGATFGEERTVANHLRDITISTEARTTLERLVRASTTRRA